MNDSPLFEQARIYLPKHLSSGEQYRLWEQLREFPPSRSIYSAERPDDDILQGDGWRGFVVIDFITSERRTISGVVISNSCDVSRENARALLLPMLFAPIVPVARYAEMLRQAGQTETQIDSHCDAIRLQKVSSIFYLPPLGEVLPEGLTLLSDIHAHPIEHFHESRPRHLFTLNNFGFYLFLIKLSIHLTRMQENVQRN